MPRRPRQRRRAHDRELALAYLAVGSADEVLLDRVIDAHIKRVLEASNQNLSLSADLLGMHRRSLQRYVRRKQQRAKRAATKRAATKRAAAKRGTAKRGTAKRGSGRGRSMQTSR
ncbi:MAG TPA: hypothetical protein VF997_25295 [Polyangia bacterium]